MRTSTTTFVSSKGFLQGDGGIRSLIGKCWQVLAVRATSFFVLRSSFYVLRSGFWVLSSRFYREGTRCFSSSVQFKTMWSWGATFSGVVLVSAGTMITKC
jgi:hypothetical protein